MYTDNTPYNKNKVYKEGKQIQLYQGPNFRDTPSSLQIITTQK